ncbi:MAG TPA: FHA domain-containing protein [Kofleriaceae bacterium]|nr:FHA domain-containing protein [Kofleriaceae bacterium]
MDVGLVCDGCHTFNPMGARACARCGEVLSLEVRSVPLSVGLAAAGGGIGAPVIESTDGNSPFPTDGRAGNSAPGGNDESSRPTQRNQTQDSSPRAELDWSSVPVRTCTMCGESVEPGFKFCGSCGSVMQEETRPAVRVPPPPDGDMLDGPVAVAVASGGPMKRTLFFGAMQAARAKLVLIKGDGLDGISYTLAGEEHIAGRADSAPLVFGEDPFMSPVHANFLYRKNQLVVRDEDSVNGVFIRIRGAVPIEIGDRFLVGEQVIEVQSSLPSGEPLRAYADGTYFYASPRPPSHFRLIQILRGGDTGLAYQAQSDVVSLGREGNDVNFPDDPFISGHHAQVSFADGGLSLTDLGSKNGTFLRVSRESVLQHGDYVFMGQQLLRVEIV